MFFSTDDDDDVVDIDTDDARRFFSRFAFFVFEDEREEGLFVFERCFVEEERPEEFRAEQEHVVVARWRRRHARLVVITVVIVRKV